MTAADDPVEVLRDLFLTHGTAEYLGEPVTQAAHMLQAAALAERAGARDALVAATLLHDVGHLVEGVTGHALMAEHDNHHSTVGARWLAQWFPPSVTEPVRLHVAAKRFLCAVEPPYAEQLSDASRFTLSVQGGPMTLVEADEFRSLPYAEDAVALRRFDDDAKDPAAAVPDFLHYELLLRSLIITGVPSSSAGTDSPR